MVYLSSCSLSSRSLFLPLILFFTLGILTLNTAAPLHAQSFTSDVLHQPFDAVLRAHVRDGQVDYTSIRDSEDFNDYLEFLNNAKPESYETDKEKLAFWINAYNALTIKHILDGYSPRTLFGRYRFFVSTEHEVAGEKLSLDDIEKEVIFAFGDPRTHFAIVCASASCPKLTSEAYVGSRLDEQMDANARKFLNNPTKNQFDSTKKRAKISKIFDWFEAEFEADSGSVLKYIAQYVDDPELAQSLLTGEYRISYLKYDWSLNGVL